MDRNLGLYRGCSRRWDPLIVVGWDFPAGVDRRYLLPRCSGSGHIGAGVHRTFIIGGPAIDTLPGHPGCPYRLLGLLGARPSSFRTPVRPG
jgi:hypothetical protein